MRLKPGRPDLARHHRLLDVPDAGPATPVTVTFLGVATLLVTDGTSAVLTDGFFSRPSLARVGLGRIRTSTERVDAALRRAGIDRLDAVIPVHSHFDHVLDSPAVAERTGAVVAGGTSTGMVARGAGLPEDRIRLVKPRSTETFGAFATTFVESGHCPPDRYPGVIDAPVVPPARASAYRCGEAWSLLLQHRPSGRRMLVQGSAGFVPGALSGHASEVAYLGVGQLGVQSEEYIRAYWHETARTVGARRVVLIHWDDFFRPLDQPLRALPYAGDDLDVTVRALSELARADGVELHLPMVWRREDPWAR